jgi:hypothetical protein
MYATFDFAVGGPYENPTPPARFGCEGDCSTGPFSPRTGANAARVNHVTTKGTAYPGPGVPFNHMGIVGLVPFPGGHGFFGLASRVPAVTLAAILTGGYIELCESAPSDGDVNIKDPQPVGVRLYADGRLGLAVFGGKAVKRSSFRITPDQWFYTVLENAYGTTAALGLDIYDASDALVEHLTLVANTTGGRASRARQKVGGETQLGLWPMELPTFHDDWYVSPTNEGPLHITVDGLTQESLSRTRLRSWSLSNARAPHPYRPDYGTSL